MFKMKWGGGEEWRVESRSRVGVEGNESVGK